MQGRSALRSPEIGAADFSGTEVLAEAARVWLVNLPLWAGAALLLHLPLIALLFLRALPAAILVPLFFVAELAIALLVKAALVKGVLHARRGLSVEFGELFEELNRTGPAVLGAGTRILAVAAVKLPKLLLPGLAWLCETFAAVPEIVMENASISAALRRSDEMISGVRLGIFGVCAPIWILAAGLPFLCGVHRGAPLIGVTFMVCYCCLRALDTSLAAVLAATAYAHLQQRGVA